MPKTRSKAGEALRKPSGAGDLSRPLSELTVSYSSAGACRCAARQGLMEKRENLLKRKNIPRRELFETLVSLNDTQPISTLPCELLTHVIEYLCPSLDVLNAANWIGKLYVCRCWYNTIISMPSFWRRIYLSSRPEWLELCLSRCAGMCVDIHFTGRFSPQLTIPILQEHRQLVRTITMHSIVRSSWAEDISQILAVPFSSLEKIVLSSVQTRSKRPELIKLPSESYAHLRTLCLQSCDISESLDCAAYTSLRSLTLDHLSWQISFKQLIDILTSAKQLQELVLSDCLSAIKDRPFGYPHTHPPVRSPVTLGRLKTLQMTTVRFSLAAQILAHIRAPNATSIDVRTYINRRQHAPLWVMLPHKPTSFSPIFSTATSLDVGFPDTRNFNLVAQSSKHRLCMQIHLQDSPGFSDTQEAMDGFLRAFSGAPIVTLRVSPAEYVSGATWKHVFRSLPALKYLNLIGYGFCDHVFTALHSVSEGGRGGIVCCPHLSRISMSDESYRYLEDGPFTKATRAQVLKTLQVRADRGTRLERLVVLGNYTICQDWTAALKSLLSDTRIAIM